MTEKNNRRKHRRIPIAEKIFIGYLIAILLMLFSNFYILHRMSKLREMGEQIGESLNFIASEREISHFVDDLRKYYLAYINAYQQKHRDKMTQDFIERASQKLKDKIAEIRSMESFLNFPDDSLLKSINSYLDSLETAISPPNKEMWDNSEKNLTLVIERSLVSAQKRTQDLLANSGQITEDATTYGILISVVMLLISAGLAIIIARKISQPIAHLRQATHYARLGKYNIQVNFESHDEIADLTSDFNAMLRALGKLDKMKAIFLSSITHDLKSPLYRVKLGAENLGDGIYGKLNDSQRKAVEQVLNDVDTLSKLIYDILDLQKLEGGKFELHLEEVEMEPFIREAVKKHAISFANKGVGLAIRMDIDKTVIKIDCKQIERVFENLLSNALKFTSKGGKVVVVTNKKNKFVHFAITDNGPGMTEDETKHIFDKFYRASSGKNVSGTGLGLAIAKQIIEAHKGRIWVESQQEIGSTFHFTLPMMKKIEKKK
ncbi:HAMP domain-containing histidine kinase [bacterium]|nr:HAMP domain-containing histidine kinase [bacterium]